MSGRKIISASIDIDSNLSELLKEAKAATGTVENLNKSFSNIKMDKSIEPRLKTMESTVKSVSQEMEKLREEIGVLSKAGGLDPKALNQYAEMTSAMADMRVEVDALTAQMGNLQKTMGDIKDVGLKNVAESITKNLEGVSGAVTGITTDIINSLQKEGPKIKEAFQEIIKSINAELENEIKFDDKNHEAQFNLVEIFGLKKTDDSISKIISKIKRKLTSDLKEVRDATANYMNLKNNGASGDALVDAMKAQIAAMETLRKDYSVFKHDYEAFFNSSDFDRVFNFDQNMSKTMADAIKDIANAFPELKESAYKTFEDIGDFLDQFASRMVEEAKSSIAVIDNALEKAGNVAKTNSSKTKTKSNKNEDSQGIIRFNKGDESIVLEELRDIIKQLQEYAEKHPVQMDVTLAPSWGTKNTQTYLKSIREQLTKAKKDKDISPDLIEKINGLQDVFGGDFATAIKNSLSKLQKTLQEEGITVGKLKFEGANIEDFKQQITEALGDVTVNVKAKVKEVSPLESEASQKAAEMFQKINEAEQYNVYEIRELVQYMKQTGASLDFSDAYKVPLKQIIKGLLDGTFLSEPEALSKVFHPERSPKEEWNFNKFQIERLMEQAKQESDPAKLAALKDKINELIIKNNEIVKSESERIAKEEQANTEEQIINTANQNIENVTAEVTKATININSADVTSANTNLTSNNTEQTNVPNTKETAASAEAKLLASKEQMAMLAFEQYKKIASKEGIDFKAIDALVADLRKAGIEHINPKLTSNWTGRLIDIMLKNGLTSSQEAYNRDYKTGPETQAKAMAAQMQSKLFEAFKKLYDIGTIQEKGTGSAKSIQMFVDKVRKSGVDFKIADQYKNNEIGKIISSMLSEGYKTVADAINARDGKSSKDNIKSAQQNIDKAVINVGTATINVKNGTINTKGKTSGENPTNEESDETSKSTTSNGAKNKSSEEEEKTNLTTDQKKLAGLIDKYNSRNVSDYKNINNYLQAQRKLLSQINVLNQRVTEEKKAEEAKAAAKAAEEQAKAEAKAKAEAEAKAKAEAEAAKAAKEAAEAAQKAAEAEAKARAEAEARAKAEAKAKAKTASAGVTIGRPSPDMTNEEKIRIFDKLLSGYNTAENIERAIRSEMKEFIDQKEFAYDYTRDKAGNLIYQKGHVSTSQSYLHTTTVGADAYTVEHVHNHPNGVLIPSFGDIVSDLSKILNKAEGVITNVRHGITDRSFAEYSASIVNADTGAKVKINYNDILSSVLAADGHMSDSTIKDYVAKYFAADILSRFGVDDSGNGVQRALRGDTGGAATFLNLLNHVYRGNIHLLDKNGTDVTSKYSYQLNESEIKRFSQVVSFIKDFMKNSNIEDLDSMRKVLQGEGYEDLVKLLYNNNLLYHKDDSIMQQGVSIPEFESEANNNDTVVAIREDLKNKINEAISKYQELYDMLDLSDLSEIEPKMNALLRAKSLLGSGKDIGREQLERLREGIIEFNNRLDQALGGDVDPSEFENEAIQTDPVDGKIIDNYFSQINNIITNTTDETLRETLIKLRNNIDKNFETASSKLTGDNISEHSEAINSMIADMGSVDDIMENLNFKARQVESILLMLTKMGKMIQGSKDLDISKSARAMLDGMSAELIELQDKLTTAQEGSNYSNLDIKAIGDRVFQLRDIVLDSISQTLAPEEEILGVIRKIDNLHLGKGEVRVDKNVEKKLLDLREKLSKAVGKNAEELLQDEFNSIVRQVGTLSRTVSASDRTFLGNFMKEWRHKNYQMMAQFFSFYDIIRYMREAVTVIKEYDTAMIEMMKVSDETRSSLERYQQTLFNTADGIGAAALTLEQSTADWMRIGESLKEASKSAQASQILMNVSEFESINDATQALVSASQAYADIDKMDIVDKINKLGNEFPIATDQLALALQNSAAALTTQGNSLEEALALVVGGNIITQDATKTGAGIRTIALRIAGTKEAKDELADLGEDVDDFIVQTESKTRKIIMDYTAVASNGFQGVDVLDENGNLRSTYAILQDIADIYKEIQAEDKKAGTNRAQALVEQLAGKNRSNIAASILTNPDTLRSAFEAAGNAEGSALRENEKYLTSVEAHITKFKNAVHELITDLVDSGFINDVIDFGTKLVNILDEIVKRIGGVGTALAGLGIGIGAKFKIFSNEDYGILNAIKTLRTPNIQAPMGLEEVQQLQNINDLVGRGITPEAGGWLKTLGGIKDSEKNLKIVEAATIGVADANELAAQATALHAAKAAALKTVIGFGVAAAVAVVATVIVNYVHKVKEAQKATKDLAAANKETVNSLEDYAKRIAEAKKTIDDEYASTDDIIEAKKELVTIQGELNDAYSTYNEIIKDTNSSLEENNRQLLLNRANKIRETVATARGTEVVGIGGNELDSSVIPFFEDHNFVEGIKGSEVAEYLGKIFPEYFDEHLDVNGNHGYFNFKDVSIEDQLNNLRQMRTLLSSEEYVNSEEAQEALEFINDRITEITNKLDEYSPIYEAYGETRAMDQNHALYNNLMNAWLEDAEKGTEESARAVQEQVKLMWEWAAEANEDGVQYWLKTMFGSYFDGINQEILDSKWTESMDAAARHINGSVNTNIDTSYRGDSYTGTPEYEMTYEDMLNYMNGDNLKEIRAKATEAQLRWMRDLKKQFIDAGIGFAEGLDKLAEQGTIRHESEINFDTELAGVRDQVISAGYMSEGEFDALGIKNSDQLTAFTTKILPNLESGLIDSSDAAYELALALQDVGKATSASQILSDMETQYKPVFDAMAEAYKAIWEDGTFKGVDKATSEQIHTIQTSIDSLNSDLKEKGMEGFSEEQINEFILTLADSSTTAEQAQDAFDNLATILVNSLNPAISQASGETAGLMQKTLTELGVINAEEVVMSRLGYTAETYAAAKEAADSVGLDLDQEISALDKDELALIADNKALQEYYGGRVLANSFSINTINDVRALNDLCDALHITKIGALDLLDVKNRLNDISWLWEHGRGSDAERASDELVSDVNSKANYQAKVKMDGNKNKSSSTSSSGKDTKQKFDWIERAIKKIQRAVTNLGKVADATYKTWGERIDALMGKTEEFHDEIGQFGRGNIDLYNRPVYRTIDENGDEWTETTFSHVEEDEYGRWVLVPRIARDDRGNAYEMSEQEAWDHYYDTGEYLGIFDTIEEANEYAEKLHLQQEAIYDDYDNFTSSKYQKLKEEIALQEQASQAYMAEARAIGLSAEYVRKIQDGKMDIETVTDEKLKEAISDYQEYYDKATDAADAVEDLRGEIAQLAQTRFDYITKQFEEMALAIDHAATRIGHIQSKMDSEGYFESSTFLKELKAGDEEKLGQLKEEAQALAASIDEAVSNGDIEYGSEQWWGMWDSLQNVNDQIVEMSANIADLDDQLRQMEWDNFDYMADAVKRLNDENDFLIDVLQDEGQLFEKNALVGDDMYANGNMSDTALAVQGLHVNNLQILEKQNQTYADEIKKINAELANDPNNKKLLERRNDLIDQQQDIIKGITSEKQAIKDLVKQGYETFLDYLQKSIDYRKKALTAQKNLYDYQNTIEDQTKTISSYRKQLAALGGDESEENQARLQVLADSLKKAEKELQQTEYEKWISDQEEMMDNLYEQFDKLISDKLDKTDEIIERAINQTSEGARTISDTISTELDDFVYDLDNTTFGMNMDDRMSNAVGAVNRVEAAIGSMMEAANINAGNELRALEALANTVATSAVNRPSYESQIPAPSGNNSGGGGESNAGTSTTNKKASTDSSAKVQATLNTLQNRLRDLERLYDYNMQMNNSYSGRAAHAANLSEQRSLMLQATTYATKAAEYKKEMEAVEKQIKQLKNAKYAKGGTIGSAIKKSGEDGIILARSGEEVLSLERVKQMQGIFKMMQPLTNMSANSVLSGGTTVNGMNISFDLPNVTNYQDFVNQARKDPSFEKMVQNMTIGASLGKSKLSKYSV